MILHVTQATYRGGHRIWLAFNDGTSGEADLAGHLDGPVFEPLRDPAVFRRFQLDPQFGTIVWNDQVDLAPEFLNRLVRNQAKGPGKGRSRPQDRAAGLKRSRRTSGAARAGEK